MANLRTLPLNVRWLSTLSLNAGKYAGFLSRKGAIGSLGFSWLRLSKS